MGRPRAPRPARGQVDICQFSSDAVDVYVPEPGTELAAKLLARYGTPVRPARTQKIGAIVIPITAPTVASLTPPTARNIWRARLLSVGSADVKKAICIRMIRKRPRWKCIVKATTRTAVGVSLVICASIASSSAQQQAPAVVPVGTVQAEHKAIAKTKDFV